MITAKDWNDALASSIEEERERLGGRPAPAEIVAYTRGELDPDTTRRVRSLLVYNADLTPFLRIPKPRTGFFLRMQTIAAGLLLPIVAVASWMLMNAHRITMQPQVLMAAHELRSSSARGVAVTVMQEADRYRLAPQLQIAPDYATYRLQLVDMSSEPRVIWNVQHVKPIGRTIELSIPGPFLPIGRYRLDVHSDETSALRPLESFMFEIVPAQ